MYTESLQPLYWRLGFRSVGQIRSDQVRSKEATSYGPHRANRVHFHTSQSMATQKMTDEVGEFRGHYQFCKRRGKGEASLRRCIINLKFPFLNL